VSRTNLAKAHKRVGETAAGREADSGLSRHLLHAQEQERKRISRELHDETGQGLMLLRLHLGMLAEGTEVEGVKAQVEQATELLDRTIAGLRRIISRLSPRVLEELGLLAAIRKEAKELSKSTGIRTQLSLPADLGELDPELDIATYRSVQEALHNVAKHSQARSVNIHLQKQDQKLMVLIEDDGVGIPSKTHGRNRGFGLIGMRDRVVALGGTLRIVSSQASGTRIRIMLPIASDGVLRKQQRGMESDIPMKRAVVSRAS
jgi:two-component system, NarL family, sensor histidine kinase UhpB